ncbi:hypothetical protein BASA81_015393 [Batrachochytrium salamandrivorans]|nr:hypothetical protein BASA81_015393 [Batrachochytrium salamandrivorans]
MASVFGIHHVAMVCKNMRKTVDFYEKGLGMKLVAIFPMHGVKGAKHCFLDAGNGTQLSFVEFQDDHPGVQGVSYPSSSGESAITSLHHMAFKAKSLEELYELKKRLNSVGTKSSRVINHGFIHSFYFYDPDAFRLEVSADVGPYTKQDLQVELLDRKLLPEECDSWKPPPTPKPL